MESGWATQFTIAPSPYRVLVDWAMTRCGDDDEAMIRQCDGDGAMARLLWCDGMVAMRRWYIAPSLSHHRAIEYFANALFEENGDRITLQSSVVIIYLSISNNNKQGKLMFRDQKNDPIFLLTLVCLIDIHTWRYFLRNSAYAKKSIARWCEDTILMAW